MKLTYSQILEAVQLLGKRDRIRLRESLDDETGGSSSTLLDDEFYQELERRRKYAERNPDMMISWDEFRLQLREKYS